MAHASLRPLGILGRRMVLDSGPQLGSRLGVVGLRARLRELVSARLEQPGGDPDRLLARARLRSVAGLDGGARPPLPFRVHQRPRRRPLRPRRAHPHGLHRGPAPARLRRDRGAARRRADPGGGHAAPHLDVTALYERRSPRLPHRQRAIAHDRRAGRACRGGAWPAPPRLRAAGRRTPHRHGPGAGRRRIRGGGPVSGARDGRAARLDLPGRGGYGRIESTPSGTAAPRVTPPYGSTRMAREPAAPRRGLDMGVGGNAPAPDARTAPSPYDGTYGARPGRDRGDGALGPPRAMPRAADSPAYAPSPRAPRPPEPAAPRASAPESAPGGRGPESRGPDRAPSAGAPSRGSSGAAGGHVRPNGAAGQAQPRGRGGR